MNRYKLKSMDIEGFRIYSERKSINFFNNLTVIYGRNGRGKTTLQDALSWLFNNDIVRYSMYNREWSRVRKTHTRSLIHPDISTLITACFENQSTKKIEQVIRGENEFICPGDLESWFQKNQRDDLLWANSLSQSKLQELAVAKGRERLENLAPLLDLTKINEEVKKIEEQIKEVKNDINDKTASLNKINNKDHSLILNEVINYANLLQEEISFINTKGKVFKQNISVYEEIQEWEIWFENTFNQINEKQSIIQGKINTIKNKYFDIVSIIHDEQEIESIDRLEKELNILLKEQKDKEDVIKGLEHKREILKKEINEIKSYFRELEKHKDLRLPYGKIILQMKSKLSIHDELKRKSNIIQKEVDLISQELEKVNQNKNLLLTEKNFIEEKYKEFLSLQGEINKREKLVKDDEEWLNLNSQQENEKLLDELEKKLDKLGGSTEALVKQKLQLEASFDVLTKYIDGDHCPLCGLKHDSPEVLKATILEQKDYWEKILFDFGEEIRAIIGEISEVRKFHSIKEIKERAVKDNITILTKVKLDIDLIINDLGRIFSKYDVKVNSSLNLTENDFINLMDCNNLELNKIDQKITDNNLKLRERNKVKQSFLDQIKEENRIFNETDEIIRGIDQKINFIERTINSILDRYNFSCEELLEVEVIEIFEKFLVSIKREIEGKYEELNTNSIEQIERKLFFKYNKQISIIEDSLLKVKYSFEHLDILKQNLTVLDNKNKLTEELQGLSLELQKLKTERIKIREIQRIQTNKEIGKLSQRIAAIFEMLSDVSPWKTIMSDAVVPDERERTNLIFRPIPFNIKSTLKEYIDKTNSNSTFAFSGGQLSLLGLSIFLSQVADEGKRNILQEPLLDTLFLDDPIQMLDTLRDDALISLLCDIARDRQVIISTSDINFANKLILASRPIWNFNHGSCGIIYYEQLKENGPVVSEFEPYDWISSQRIYLPEIKQAK